jgi:hypothetical protein
MNEITRDTIGQFCLTGDFDIAASVSADSDAKKAGESVSVILRFKMKQTPISDIIQSSLKDKRINWQTKGRDKVDKLNPGQVIVLDYKGGRAPVDPKQTARDYMASLTPEERAKFIADLQGK